MAPFLPGIIHSGYVSGYRILLFHPRPYGLMMWERGSKRRRHLPNSALLNSFAFLHLRYVDWTAWFPGSRQGQLSGKSLPNLEMDERQDSILQNPRFVRCYLRESLHLGQGVRKVIFTIRMALLRWESEVALGIIIWSSWISRQGVWSNCYILQRDLGRLLYDSGVREWLRSWDLFATAEDAKAYPFKDRSGGHTRR